MPQRRAIAPARLPPDPHAISVDEVSNGHVKRALAHWRSACGQRRFPARSDLTLRGLAPVLTHTLIVAVIDHGADYEYRYVGDSERQAFRTDFKGLRLSRIEARTPEFGARLRSVYERVRTTCLPLALRGPNDHKTGDTGPSGHETVFLPLGAGDEAVDHILIVGVKTRDALPLPHDHSGS